MRWSDQRECLPPGTRVAVLRTTSSTHALLIFSRCSSLLLLASLLSTTGAPPPAMAAKHATFNDLPTFVTPPRQPTQVSIETYLIGLSRVSEPSAAFPTYEVEMFIRLSWHDPRLSFRSDEVEVRVFQEEEAQEKLSEIWSPDLEIQNEVEQRESESIDLTIRRDGLVE